MKTIFLLSALLLGSFTVGAQTIVISDGETIRTDWFGVGSTGTEFIEYWDNPSKDTVNSTEKAINIYLNNGDKIYSGGGLGSLDIDATVYNKISILVLKNVEGPVQLELEDESGNTDAEYAKNYLHKDYNPNGGWQELVFDVPENMKKITKLIVSPHFVNTNENPIENDDDKRMWWDEVKAFKPVSTSVTNPTMDSEIISTEVFSLDGRLLEVLEKDASINDSSLPKGVYIVKNTNTLGATSTSKLMKTR